MNGIDISRWNNIDLSKVKCDFVIVKATQGTSFVSPTFTKQIGQAMSLGKYLGIYHYAGGGGAIPEAKHFLKTAKEYIGKAILVLDWEWDQNPNFNMPSYAVAWLNYIKEQTGITPFIYMSKSVCRQFAKQWDASYPLWCAQYKNQQPTGYQDNPWTDNKGFGVWDGCKILQYSSKGQLSGYSGNLDLDKSYMNSAEWLKWASGDLIPEEPSEQVRPILKKGDRGEVVRAWQMLLKEKGYDIGKSGADGIFGNDTEKAVMRYQQDHQIEAGYIGPKTWETI